MIKRIAYRVYYFAFVALFLFTCASLIFIYPQGRSFFIFNGLNAPPLDWFFSWYTHVGDGLTGVIICALLLLFYNLGSGMFALAGMGICGIISYACKYYFFIDSDRPHHFFWGNKMIHYVEGVVVNTENSFPSGHTLTAFFIFTFIALLSFSRAVFIQVLLALFAVLVAYSRVYLAQHFVGDIIAGACIGILLALMCYKVYTKSKNIPVFNKSIIKLVKK
ncbi:MAG TPA: phosphatase PAP2 family protein [Flavobacteriales bacterium]|nr:phosphatase PAP2 family protein [Flavobacteriales bacterium]